MAQHISKEISKDYQKYIKSDKSSGRSKDISKNKEIDNSRNINLSNTKQSINIKINNTINPFRDDSLKGSIKSTNISPSKKTLTQMTPT